MSILVDDIDSAISARVRGERAARHWTLSDLAERAGVSKAMISKIERGEASPTAALLGRLSAAFGLTLSALLSRRGGLTARPGAARRPADMARSGHRLSPPPGRGAVELPGRDDRGRASRGRERVVSRRVLQRSSRRSSGCSPVISPSSKADTRTISAPATRSSSDRRPTAHSATTARQRAAISSSCCAGSAMERLPDRNDNGGPPLDDDEGPSGATATPTSISTGRARTAKRGSPPRATWRCFASRRPRRSG